MSTPRRRYTQEFKDQLVEEVIEFSKPIFALDFIGDTLLVTAIGMQAYLTDDGELDPQKVQAMAGSGDLFDVHTLTTRGSLDAKVDFIIRGIEQQR